MKRMMRKTLSLSIMMAMGSYSGLTLAQTDNSGDENEITEEIVVYGIRNALATALDKKRDATNIKEIIQAEDIGKLPDQNLAEVLENVTGVQITRSQGVGTGVQIRGTDKNRVEINGVSTVPSGNSRTGVSFDDVPAALIGSIEVTKVPTAKTIEGSVGGTINLKTLRGLGLKERVISVRAQGERSDLAESTTPKISGTFGDNWETDAGDFGFVISASYQETDAVSIDPRFDRDRENLPGTSPSSLSEPFLRVQFLDQFLSRTEYETKNVTSSFEFAPNEELKFYADLTINKQERVGQSQRVQFSGTGGQHVIDNTNNTDFERINLGTVDGPNGPLVLGEVLAVTKGVLGVGVNGGGVIDPNVRTQTLAGSRVTDGTVFAIGGEWERDKLKLEAQISRSESESDRPNMNVTLDFVNPNGPQPQLGSSVDNGVPTIFDATGGTLQFGIAPGEAESPTSAQLLDPANYAFRQIAQGADVNDNDETAIRFDATYDLTDTNPFIAAVKAGFRWNESNAFDNTVSSNVSFTNPTSRFYRPRGDLFNDILVPGQSNFNGADSRTLYVRDYLVASPDLAFGNPAAILNSLNNAIDVNNQANVANGNIMAGDEYPSLSVPTGTQLSFFDVSEETLAFYLQGDYDFEVGEVGVRGNLGVRYVSTDRNAMGNVDINGDIQDNSTKISFSNLLPRFNLVVEPMENLLVRAGAAKDIRRPDFNDLSPVFTFPLGAQTDVEKGNPLLKPEEVTSYDISAEYYLSEAAFVSIGYFHKKRIRLIGDDRSEPVEENVGGQIERDITDPCEGGGIFNPAVTDRGVWSSVPTTPDNQGICVPEVSKFNLGGDTTQKGFEIAFQYDLSEFEDKLGWASGFGLITNYTIQEQDSSSDDFYNAVGDANALNDVLGRTDTDQSTPTLDDDVVEVRRKQFNLSEDAYNITLFYDKYDISVRMRYTWRSEFEEDQFVSFNLPRIVGARSQMNLSASYKINDMFTVGIDGVNILRDDRPEWCVNEGALLCAQGLTDRRVIFGITGNF